MVDITGALDDRQWRKLGIVDGVTVFMALEPWKEDGWFLGVTTRIAVNRGDDWRFTDQTAPVECVDRLPEPLEDKSKRATRIALVHAIHALDDGRHIDPNGVYAPLIAELSAL